MDLIFFPLASPFLWRALSKWYKMSLKSNDKEFIGDLKHWRQRRRKGVDQKNKFTSLKITSSFQIIEVTISNNVRSPLQQQLKATSVSKKETCTELLFPFSGYMKFGDFMLPFCRRWTAGTEIIYKFSNTCLGPGCQNKPAASEFYHSAW